VPLHQAASFNNNLSTHRMVEKTRRMRNPVQVVKGFSR
jgi:hypothetical protein